MISYEKMSLIFDAVGPVGNMTFSATRWLMQEAGPTSMS
jgi:hypothetical protein